MKSFEEFNITYQKYLDKLSTCSKNTGVFLQYLNKYKQETDRFVQTINTSAENMAILQRKRLILIYNFILIKLFNLLRVPTK